VYLSGVLSPCGAARAQAADSAMASHVPSHLFNADPNLVWEALIGGIVLCAFLASVVLWAHSALRNVRVSQQRRNAFVSSALNNLNQGVVMTDAQHRIVFCSNRYREMYGLSPSDIRPNIARSRAS
jgi:PAS domain-containing protein